MRKMPLDHRLSSHALRSFKSRLHGFGRDRRGVAAIEFAFVVPLALSMLVGEYSLCEAISIDRKVTITAHTIADLIARQQTGSVSASTVTGFLSASTQLAAPYSTSNMAIVVAELTTDANSNTTVTWSKAQNATALTAGASFTLPAGMAVAGASLIYASVSYSYTPPIGSVFTGAIPIADTFFMNPRSTSSVQLTTP